MRRKLTETTVIISTLKWSALATIVVIAVGISTTIFIKALNWRISLTNNYNAILYDTDGFFPQFSYDPLPGS